MKVFSMFMVLFAIVYGGGVLVTGWWTITGHCCGSPLLGADWDSCLPVADKMWPDRWLMKGHCDNATWKRVP
jgi:hypothetical protein